MSNLRKRDNKISLVTEPNSITVKLKRGAWEIEITSPEDRVQQAVESVLAGMASKEPTLVDSEERDAAGRRVETCRGVLTTLWKGGWVADPPSLSGAHEEPRRGG